MSDSAITLYIVPVVFSALPLIYEHVNGGGTGGNNNNNNNSGNSGNRSSAEVTVTYSSIQAANEWCLEIFQILDGLLGMFWKKRVVALRVARGVCGVCCFCCFC